MIQRLITQKQLVLKQKHENRFQDILRQCRTYIVVLDTAGIVIDVIKTNCRYHLPVELQLGRPLWQVGWWDRLPEVQRELKEEVAQAAQGKYVENSGYFYTPIGEERYGTYSLSPLQYEHNKVSLIVFEAFDITELKHKEREAQNIFDMSLDIVCMTTIDGYYLRINKAFEDILGYTPEDAVGVLATDWVHPEDRDRSLRRFARLAQGEPQDLEENRYLAKDGSYKWLSWSARPNLNENEIYIIARDITEQKMRDQMRDTFMGMASHELRTPITGISTSLQMMRKRLNQLSPENKEEFAEQMERIQKNLARAEQQVVAECRIINDIMDANRITQGRLEIFTAPIDLLYIIFQVITDIQGQHPERKLNYEPPASAFLPVQVDAMRISQVITNLLTNAIKYSPEEKPIAISVACDQSLVKVSIRDYGPGLTGDEQKRIWERFYQIPGRHIQGDSCGSMGLGLGLYICQTIITLHGGEIGVESTPSEGSTFWFTIPLTPRSAPTGRHHS
ncbi:PAS domain-containing sensor histidine kinase [Ktedonospora formicarum]|uniref:histidine kinase n=1 Tax=Ktedonospora formicarum TaxID=2778364 RepID=A0A8J3MWY0_9CHLR|nr:PAS domain S-box protein [Ktedonospora formicarum]GHO49436.1 hypothetical protein KSX_75990 [Ktedonospora formicarum]